MTDIFKQLKEFDNKGTFVIGYRNLFNIVVIFVSAVYMLYSQACQATAIAGIVMFTLGSKWFLTQCRENIDAITIEDTLKPGGPK